MRSHTTRQLRSSARLAGLSSVLCTFLFIPASPRADLVHGTVDLFWGAFDFSEQAQSWGALFGDVYWCDIVAPPLGDQLCTWNNAGILDRPDTTLVDITFAPPDFESYEGYLPPIDEQAYVVRTGDGFYAKFAVREFQPFASLLIEYYVQMDGTNNLRDDLVVAVEPTTWGRVKALYR